MNNIKDKIKIRFNAASSSYDAISYIQKDSAKILVRKLYEFDLKFYPHTILDLGTGTGYVPEILLSHYPASNYMLNDIAPQMIKIVQNKFEKYEGFEFYAGDMENITFPETDLTISNFAMQWAVNLEATVQKFFLRSKIFAFSCLLEGTFAEWDLILKSYDGMPSIVKAYPTAEDLTATLKTFGAHDYHFDSKDFQLIFPNARSFMTYLKNLGAQTSNEQVPQSVLKSLIKDHDQEFPVTYKVFFGIMKRF